MDKKRIEIIITVVLVLVLVIVVANSIRTVKQKLKAPVPAVTGALHPQTTTAPQAAGQKKKLAAEDLVWARCPFSGKVYSASDKSLTLKLSGILWDEKMPQALINNEIVKKGESIGNFIVVKINTNSVVVNDGTKDLELTVGQ
jgi:hypothetical protein